MNFIFYNDLNKIRQNIDNLLELLAARIVQFSPLANYILKALLLAKHSSAYGLIFTKFPNNSDS